MCICLFCDLAFPALTMFDFCRLPEFVMKIVKKYLAITTHTTYTLSHTHVTDTQTRIHTQNRVRLVFEAPSQRSLFNAIIVITVIITANEGKTALLFLNMNFTMEINE